MVRHFQILALAASWVGFVQLSSAQTLTPEADTYVRDGTYAGKNFGAVSPLLVKTDRANSNCDAYVRFTLPDASIASARLRLYASVNAKVAMTLGAYAVSDTSWRETAMIWSNRPPLGTLLGSNVVSSTKFVWVTIDVSSYVAAVAATNRSVTFGFHASIEPRSAIEIQSRESGNRPQLVVVTNSTTKATNITLSVSVTSPTSNAIVAPEGLNLSAAVVDSTKSIKQVTWLTNGVPFASSFTAPYSVPWTNASPGLYTLAAQVVDGTGRSVTSAPVTVTVDLPGLAGAWTFDEGAGDASADRTGSGRLATITSATNWVPGRSGSAVAGTGVTIPNTNHVLLPTTSGEFTLSLWLKPYSVPLGWASLLASDAYQVRGWRLALHRDLNGRTNVGFWSTQSGGTLQFEAAVPLLLNQWQKLDVTFDGATARIFWNGRQCGVGFGGSISSTGAVRIAAITGMAALDGAVDDLKVYKRALAAEELGPQAQVQLATVFQGGVTNVALDGRVPPGKEATFTIVTGPTNGTIMSLTRSNASYQARWPYKGPDCFQYVVSDGSLTSAPASVLLSVVTPHYISPQGSETISDGGAPERSWRGTPFAALDDIVRTNNFYDCFFYAPGTYEMSGALYLQRRTASPGCKHIGSGGTTVLRYVNALYETGDDVLFGAANCGAQVRSDDFEVSHLTIDCNAPNQPKHIRGAPYTITVNLGAIVPIERIRLLWDYFHIEGASWTTGHAREYSVLVRNITGDGYSLIYTNFTGVGGTNGVEEIQGFTGLLTDQVMIVLGARGDRDGQVFGFYGLQEIEVYSAGRNVALKRPVHAGCGFGDVWLEWAGVAYSPDRLVDGDRTTQWLSRGQGHIGAVGVTGNNVRLSDVRVINFGTKAGSEGFPVGVTDGCTGCYDGNPAQWGNVFVEDCIVESPALNNVDGCTVVSVLALSPATVTNTVVRRCVVSGVRSDFSYSHAYGVPCLENSTAADCTDGWYLEPGCGVSDADPVVLRSNVFQRVDRAIAVNFHPQTTFNSIVADRNVFLYSTNSPTWGFLPFENEGNHMTNLVFHANMFLPDGAAPLSDNGSGGVFAGHSLGVTIGPNLIQLPANPLAILDESAADTNQMRAFFGDTNVLGAPQPIIQMPSRTTSSIRQWAE